jgi:hypothetical protein
MEGEQKTVTKFWHRQRSEPHQPAGTVAVIWCGTKRFVGFSECKSDPFDRKKGRKVSLDRAKFAKDGRPERRAKRHKYLFSFDASVPLEQTTLEIKHLNFLNELPPHLWKERPEFLTERKDVTN